MLHMSNTPALIRSAILIYGLYSMYVWFGSSEHRRQLFIDNNDCTVWISQIVTRSSK